MKTEKTKDQLWPPEWKVNEADWCADCIYGARTAGCYWKGCDEYPSKHPIAYAKVRQTLCDCYARAVARGDERAT